ncbi:hypothetical protein ACFS2C_16025 [Prauserella oleivorans]|uniref:Uncharacterized protein n=1 Tax=Prauserella oleivorans TaxID=1478153 RepID=A0ABW5WBQ1_9PSEU
MTSAPRPPESLRHRLDWRLVVALTVVALLRPIASITGVSDALGKPATPIILTVAISVVWILVAGLGRARDPLLTLVATGLVYALASLVLSAVLSPMMHGELQGPLANPAAIVPLFAVNAAWGAACGLCALGLRRLRS